MAALAATVLCGLAALPPQGAWAERAPASDGPSISFRVPGEAEAGARIVAQGRVARLEGHGSVLAELRAGGKWRTLSRLSVDGGRFRISLRLPSQGAAVTLRAAVRVGGRRVATSPPSRVRLRLPPPTATSSTVPAPSPPPPAAEPIPPPPPSDSAYWGAWIDPGDPAQPAPINPAAISQFEAISRKPPSLLESFSAFAECSGSNCTFIPFPAQQLEAIRGRGAVPMFSWASEATSGQETQPDFQLSDITAGTYDKYITEWATAARNWGHPFFLRYDWEMNGIWYPWSETVNGNAPGQYVEAWRHVHDIFAKAGATNATWVWCPYINPNKNLTSSIAGLYPGDEYVDWTCLDGYNRGTSQSNTKWRSFSYLFSPQYGEITSTIAPSKPMLIAEVASSEQGGSKAAWISEMFSELPTQFPAVRGLMWFDYYDQGNDWPLETSAGAESAFAAGISDPRYLANTFGALTGSPIAAP